MSVRIGINGFGRIGRNVLKAALNKHDDMQVIAINDLYDTRTLAHLFKYDSVFGTFDGEVEPKDSSITVNGKEIKVFAEKDPADIPWKDLGVEIVVESSGVFTAKDKAIRHIQSGGAKKVVISAPAKGEDITIVMGVNEDQYNPKEHHVISNASCTTNCLAPVAKVLMDNFGISKGLMNTIHSYTNDQRILDLPHRDLRRARAAAVNIIPTTTGAAKAVALVIPELKGKLNGFALRIPTSAVSVVDLTCLLQKSATAEQINDAMREASESRLKGILGYSEEPLVSMDYKGSELSSVVDGLSTMVIKDDLIKVVSWYDNEWGYSHRVMDLVRFISERGL
ncbi:MAG: type I glyceraldehyde-3-phosphate dehydrogenase [Thermoanaerobacterales bacterium]|jgi:glyceraldehyde 3-phosphate dehydrogenase|nr:type I glyceraldehyde-3-phosphate dehydrogenase [Thermoanaerobacterales bacterium]